VVLPRLVSAGEQARRPRYVREFRLAHLPLPPSRRPQPHSVDRGQEVKVAAAVMRLCVCVRKYPEEVVRGEGVPRAAHEAGRAQARRVEVPPDVHLQLFILLYFYI
jgi:hypothetical protein